MKSDRQRRGGGGGGGRGGGGGGSSNDRQRVKQASAQKQQPPVEQQKERRYKPAKVDEELAQAIEQVRRDGGAGSLKFDDIAGIDEAKKLLFDAVNLPILAPHFFKPHPDGRLDPYNGILLFGPPGTGKTILARAVASQCKTSFFNVEASTIESKWKGEGVKNIRLLFDMARFYSPSVIFIDEIDRTLQGDHESSGKIRGEVLTQMQGAREDAGERVMVLAVSNWNKSPTICLLPHLVASPAAPVR